MKGYFSVFFSFQQPVQCVVGVVLRSHEATPGTIVVIGKVSLVEKYSVS
jgi:hypothetical protein